MVRLSRTDGLILASGALVLLPALRAVLAWPWLWLVPGYFLAKNVLGARGPALAILSPVLSIAVTSAVCLPCVAVVGPGHAWAVVASVAVFAAATALAGDRWRVRLPPIPTPPRAYVALLAAYAMARLAAAVAPTLPPSTDDGAYFVGIVRGLATTFPPINFAACESSLRQPWAYWLLYALTHVVSHLDVGVTLNLASVVVSLALLGLHYAVVALATGDPRSGALTLPLSLGTFETRWIVDSLRTGALSHARLGYTDQQSYASWLGGAFYVAPALLLGLAVVFFLLAHARTREPRSIVVAAALFTAMPFFHPVHFFVLGTVLAFTFAYELGRRRITAAHALFAVAPLPFLAARLFVAPELPMRLPFDLPSSHWLATYVHEHWSYALDAAGLLLLPAAFGLFVRVLLRRVLLGLAVVVPLALYVLTINFAHNYHWTFDWVLVGGVTLAAAGLGAWVRRARVVAPAVIVVLVGVLVLGDHRGVQAIRPLPRDAVQLGEWVRTHTPEGAAFVVAEDDADTRAAVLGTGQRRLLMGAVYLLRPTSSPAEIDAWSRTNRAVLDDPCAPVAALAPISYVAFGPAAPREARAAWSTRAAPAYESGAFSVYATASARCAAP